MELAFLSKADVLRIHSLLSEEFAQFGEPISPPGVKSEPLLESAIGRQFVSLGGVLKYGTPLESAATLAYGLCLDHPFHNGNKRTALVALLAHLDRNKFSLKGNVRHDDLYRMIVGVATHSLGLHFDSRRRNPQPTTRRKPDEMVREVVSWLRPYVGKMVRGERAITFKELDRILARHGFITDLTKGNTLDIFKVETREEGFFRRKSVQVKKHIGALKYSGGHHRIVPMSVLKLARRICRLREEDGWDQMAFYDEASIVDGLINTYRTILRRLASK